MKNSKSRWLRLALGAVLLFFSGIIYAWSLIKAPFTEIWNPSQSALNYTITMSMFCIGGFISGIIAKYLSSKLRMLISGICVGVGFFITSLINSNSSIALLYIGYGFLAGLGIGIVYNIVIASTNAWFPDKKGVCSGVLMMAFGLSSFGLGNLAVKVMEPNFGWSKTYLIYGIVIGAVIIFGGLLVRAPREEEIAPYIKSTGKKAVSEISEDYTTIEMVKRPSFWLMFFFFIILTAPGGIAFSFGKDILKPFLSEDTVITIVSSLAILNGLGRIISGIIFDVLGKRATQFITCGVSLVAVGATLLGLIFGNSALAVTGIVICAFSYGFSPTLSSALVADYYGRKNFSLNFAAINLILIPSSFFATIAGKIYNSTQSFVTVFVILFVLAIIELAETFFIKKA